MTTLSSPVGIFYSTPRVASNCGEDFLRVVIELVRAGAIGQNDTLILDNSKVHFARDTQEAILFVLNAVGADLKFLPPYSPEINPCELLFNNAKQWLHFNGGVLPVLQEIHISLQQIPYRHVAKSYHHALVTVPVDWVREGRVKTFVL
jgi:hypothetical protein